MANGNLEQPRFDLIPHPYGTEVIRMRSGDGYINATAMCKAANRPWSRYWEVKASKEFADALSSALGIPRAELIQSLSGGLPEHQGTWVHPQVAIHLAQWLSPDFAVKVSQWVYEWMSGKSPTDKVWRQFEDRVSLVYDRIPKGYFCIFKECAPVFAAMISAGIDFGTRMLLDGSVGSHWAKHWKGEDLAGQFGESRVFDHHFPPYFPQALSNPQDANCYPDAALPYFRRWMEDVYLKTKLSPYLETQVSAGKISPALATNAVAAIESRDRNRALPRKKTSKP